MCLQFKKEHADRLEQVFERMDEAGGQLNLKKCSLGCSKVKLLGHVVSQNGIEPDPKKVKALILLPTPSISRQLQTFVQKVKYMTGFIKMASKLLYPLK